MDGEGTSGLGMEHLYYKDSDRGHTHFLKATWEMGKNECQEHLTWPFLKINRGLQAYIVTCDMGSKVITAGDMSIS